LRANPIPQLFHAGEKRILFVMATRAEYGAHLQGLITPIITGVGPVEAALGTMHALTLCKSAQIMPDLVISLGSAGSSSLEQGAIYQASSVSYRDMDASALGFEKGCTPFLDQPATILLPTRLRQVPSASLSTGANIVSGAAYDKITADMVDMESFAVLRACQLFNLPMIGLRGISDGARELHHYDDWASLLGHIDEELANIIAHLDTFLMEPA
jgi:adenosylhomocysteine nucleosidase